MTEKKVIETQYGWYQKNDNKVNVDEIIGIVKTDKQTNSVQLKKEAQLSICEKRVLELEKENEQLKDALNQRTEQCDKYYEENEQLKKQLSKYDKPKISIFNKDKGDWKWNDNNDIIINIRNGKSFYLRNSGAVENLVDLLNALHEENTTIKQTINDMITTERTELGRSVLKQLRDRIQ